MTRLFETIGYAVESSVATVTLNRPDRMNAFTRGMMRDLIDAFDLIDADDAVRAVIVTGAGDRAFCAGADLSEGTDTFNFTSRSAYEGDRVGNVFRDTGGQVALRIFESHKPVIGAVNGAAVGVGASLLLPMDIRIAAETARFGFVFARRGIAPDAAASWFLPRVVGIGTALSWTLSGRVFTAAEAFERNLVEALHPPDRLMAAARQIACDIAENCAPVSVAATRHLMWQMLGASHPMAAHRADSRIIQARGASADAREGVASFLEKRPPVFPDRVSEGLPPGLDATRPDFF